MTDWTPVSPGDPSWTPADVENSNTQAAQSAAEAAASATEAADSASAAADSATSATSSATTASDAATSILNSNVLVFADGTTPAAGDFPAYSNGAWVTLASTGTGPVVRANNPTLVTPTIGVASGTSLELTDSLSITSSNTLLGKFIGTGATTKNIQLDNAASQEMNFLFSDNATWKWFLGKDATNAFRLYNIDYNYAPFSATNDGWTTIRSSNGNATSVIAGTSGGVALTDGATAWASLSDYRAKNDDGAFLGASDIVKNVPIHLAALKTDPANKRAMFLAHEVQAQMPWAVVGEKDAVDADGKPVMQLLQSTDPLVPVLWASQKEALTWVATLETALQGALARIATLEAAAS